MPIRGVIVYFCPVYHHVVSDRDVVADFYGGFLIECVKHTAVLDVDAVSDSD